MITTAEIKIWNKLVGAIAWDSKNEIGSFEFNPEFEKNNWDVAPIKMPLENSEGKVFSFPDLRNTSTFKGLPGLVADLLPDRYGNALINTWLTRQGRPTDSLNPVELLCFIGSRGMGAIEVEPAFPKAAAKSTNIEIDSLISVADKILSGRTNFTTNVTGNEEKALIDILKIGTSAGGARAKAVIAYNTKTGEVRSGQTKAPEGFSAAVRSDSQVRRGNRPTERNAD